MANEVKNAPFFDGTIGGLKAVWPMWTDRQKYTFLQTKIKEVGKEQAFKFLAETVGAKQGELTGLLDHPKKEEFERHITQAKKIISTVIDEWPKFDGVQKHYFVWQMDKEFGKENALKVCTALLDVTEEEYDGLLNLKLSVTMTAPVQNSGEMPVAPGPPPTVSLTLPLK